MNTYSSVYLFLVHLLLTINVFASDIVKSPYAACKDITLVSQKKYLENESSWKNWENKCNTKVQITDETGVLNISSLNEGAQYLKLATKVTDKIIINLDKSKDYADCSAKCFSGKNSCISRDKIKISCIERKKEIMETLSLQSRKLRKELALSRENPDLLNITIDNVLTYNDKDRINWELKDFDLTTPNPVGRSSMRPDEILHVQNIIQKEKKLIEEDFQKMLKEKNLSDKEPLHHNWVTKVLMDRIDQRKEAHQEAYRKILYEETPLFAVIERPIRFENGDKPIWNDTQIANAFKKLSATAAKTKSIVTTSQKRGKLEFSRLKGEALALWLKSLIPGTNDSNDLLYYMGMNNQVEEVLKEEPDLCAAATTMHERLSSKEIQNTGIFFAASFAGGPLSKGATKSLSGVFRIGRGLTGAEASNLTGLALGSTYLGDSFRQYNTAVTEVKNGLRDSSEILSAKENIELNLVLTPTVINSSSAVKITKKKLLENIKKAIKLPGEVFNKARKEWKYIALGTSIQLTAETAAKWDDVYNKDPAKMAKNVLTNEEVQKNIGFMTLDTVLMTGISKNLKTVKARYLASGFVGLTNSSIINLVIKDEDNYKQVAFDTGWEALIGNAQVQLELKGLEHFEAMAQKNKNPKLKLIGYAIVIVDEGLGYYIYSKASSAISETENSPKVELVPIFVNK